MLYFGESFNNWKNWLINHIISIPLYINVLENYFPSFQIQFWTDWLML